MKDRLRLLVLPVVAVAAIGLAVSPLHAHALAAASSTAGAAARLQESGQRIGVVDADRLSQESDLGRTLSERLRSFQNSAQSRIDGLRNEIEQLEAALETVSPVSDQARDLRRRHQVKMAEFQAEGQALQSELQVMIRQSNVDLLRAVNRAVDTVAQDNDFDLVLRKSPPIPSNFDPSGQNAGEQLERVVSRQVTLFVDPGIDITSLVLTQMNADLEAGGGVDSEEDDAGENDDSTQPSDE